MKLCWKAVSRSGLAAMLLLAASASAVVAEEILVGPPGTRESGVVTDLQRAVRNAEPGTIIRLLPGVYELKSRRYVEAKCGNCEEERSRVEATAGLQVSGSGIRIQGQNAEETIIHTNAGYGVVFENCDDCSISNVTVTGGVRDPDATATNAGILVKTSNVNIFDCVIRDNIGDSTVVRETVVGIAGIVGREGSSTVIKGNRILRNSWDGIALYRGAHAVIESNVIDGVDLARGDTVGGGRGVGIGVTWDADASIRGNLVRRYWKGIGAFLNAQVTVEENVIEHVATWGLTLWDAGVGKPTGFFLRNVIYDTGACGASIIRESEEPPFPGRFVQNVLVQTGQDPKYDGGEPYCFQLPIAQHAVPSIFTVAGNVLYANRIADGVPCPDDIKEEAFRYRVQTVWDRLAPWEPLRESDFWREFAPRP